MKIYGGYVGAFRSDKGYGVSPICLNADDREEAIRVLLDFSAEESFPKNEGWTQHCANVQEVTPEQIAAYRP